MATTKKALVLSEELAADLAMRLGMAATVSYDTDNCPLVSFGSGVAGTANILIKVKPEALPGSQDILGLASIPYGPHIIQLATEANDASVAATPDCLTPAQLLATLGEIVMKGCKVEWYESATTVVPTTATLVAANLKAAFQPSMKYPLIQNS